VQHLSDWLRWLAMHKYGGWWADMDTICLRRLPDKPTRMFQTLLLKRSGGLMYKRKFYSNTDLGRPNNAVFKVPAGDPCMKHMIEYTSAWICGGKRPLGHGSEWDTFIFEFGRMQVVLGYEKYVMAPLVLAALFNGSFPTEHARPWYNNMLPGYSDIRKHTIVLDFWGTRFKTPDGSKVLTVLSNIDAALHTAATKVFSDKT
jgi:hypothetical protein